MRWSGDGGTGEKRGEKKGEGLVKTYLGDIIKGYPNRDVEEGRIGDAFRVLLCLCVSGCEWGEGTRERERVREKGSGRRSGRAQSVNETYSVHGERRHSTPTRFGKVLLVELLGVCSGAKRTCQHGERERERERERESKKKKENGKGKTRQTTY